MQNMLGKQIGNYRITAELASGSFGSVYIAKHSILDDRPPVAIKLLHTHLGSEKERERFFQEARFLDKLRHPHILPLEDTGLYQGFPYLVVEYASNGSLRDQLRLQPSQPLPIGEALNILSQTAQALQYAHDQNIVHRDLKPANILFNTGGEALLADFGIAIILEQTKRVEVEGTPPYMAPEQFQGEVSKRSDQYALGCIAYQLVTGKLPFTAPDFVSIGYKHVHEQPILPTQFNPNLPGHVEQAILKAMAKKREDRYSDISAFVAALQGPSHFQVKNAPTNEISIVLPPSPNTTAFSARQEGSTEMFDAEIVLERIQHDAIPSTWHIIQPSRLKLIGVASSLIFLIAGSGWLVPRISMIWAIDLNWLSLPGLVLGSLVGVLVAKVLWSTTKEDRLVLTPEGFIYFSKETPCHIINYEEVKDIQFDSSSTVLTVTTTLLRSKIAIGIFENPEVIAQNIDQACVRFKKSHNMLWAPERQPTKQLEDKFRKTFEKAKDIFQ